MFSHRKKHPRAKPFFKFENWIINYICFIHDAVIISDWKWNDDKMYAKMFDIIQLNLTLVLVIWNTSAISSVASQKDFMMKL